MFPSLSTAIAYGLTPVSPRVVDAPFGMSFVTLFAAKLVV